MALYERAEKILAGANNSCAVTVRLIDCVRWRQRHCPFHLYAILKKSYEKRYIKINDTGHFNGVSDPESAICMAMDRYNIFSDRVNRHIIRYAE